MDVQYTCVFLEIQLFIIITIIIIIITNKLVGLCQVGICDEDVDDDNDYSSHRFDETIEEMMTGRSAWANGTNCKCFFPLENVNTTKTLQLY